MAGSVASINCMVGLCCLLSCFQAAFTSDDTLVLIQGTAEIHRGKPTNWTGCVGFKKAAPTLSLTECPSVTQFNDENAEVGQRRRVRCLRKMLPAIEAKLCDLCTSLQCTTNHKEVFHRIKDKIQTGEKFIVELLHQAAQLHKTLPNEMTEWKKTFLTWDVDPPFGLDLSELEVLFPTFAVHLRDIADLNDNQRVGMEELKAFFEAGSAFSEVEPVTETSEELLTPVVPRNAMSFRSKTRSIRKRKHHHKKDKKQEAVKEKAKNDEKAVSFAKKVAQMKNATTNLAKAWLVFDANSKAKQDVPRV